MKHIFENILRPVAVVAAVLALSLGLVGCNEEQIEDYQSRLTALEEGNIPSVNQQISGIQASIPGLEAVDTELRGLISALEQTAAGLETSMEATKGEVAQVKAAIASLQAMDISLEAGIDSLKAYVDSCYAAGRDWLSATYLTLEIYGQAVTSLAGYKQNVLGKVGRLSSLDESLSARVAAVDASIAALETSMKSWVSEKLTGYWTIAQTQARIDALVADYAEVDDSLAGVINALKTEIVSARAEITTAYQTAIAEAITASNGVITPQISSGIDAANAALQARIDSFNASLTQIEINTIVAGAASYRLLNCIRSMVVVPDRADGSVTMRGAPGDSIRFEIYPAEIADELTLQELDLFDLSYVSTATRAAALTPLPVTEVSFDSTFFIVKFDGSVFPAEVMSGGRKVNARLAVVAGDVTRASDFFPLTFEVSGSVSVGCVQTGKRSVEMLGRAVPLPMQPVSEMGFYYATSAEGLLSAPIKVVATTGDETGSYGCILSRLKYEQTYYYRSYLVRGGETVYGEVKSFTVPRPHIYQEPVDLGLSVKWASCNLGATVPEEYGDYYSWGEMEPYYESLSPLIWKPGKSYGYSFRSSSFAFYNPRLRHEIEITKYNFDPEFGAVDNKYDLEPEDDVAVEELGGGWRIPTIEEVRELVDNCTWTWTNVNGVKGRMVSGNGNSIFLPAAGVIESLEWEELYWRDNPGEAGRYWSTKMLDYRDPDEIRCLYLEETDYRASTTGRFFGVPVRPVKE